jgi:23S rRNA (adenine2503-C2)-methyltransferase
VSAKINLRILSKNELIAQFKELGEPAFRAKQVYHWLWKNRVLDFSLMSNIGKPLQVKLAELFEIYNTEIDITQISTDGTIKVGFKTYDGEAIEGVIIPSDDRVTACISSQVGCTLSCTFCATGFLPRKRNLFAFEIYDQVYLLNQLALKQYENKGLTNIVYMGMGEPLLNYDEVVKSLYLLHSEDEGLGYSAKRITVSTSGIVRNIKRLTDEGIKINLALSLHASNNAKRTAIMDINKSNPLEELMSAFKEFYDKTKNKITYEYVLLAGFNDSPEDATELVALCQAFPVYVNIIEYNAVEGTPFSKSKKEHRDRFLQILRDHNVAAKVRKSRGKDIDAACGQLANKIVNQAV